MIIVLSILLFVSALLVVGLSYIAYRLLNLCMNLKDKIDTDAEQIEKLHRHYNEEALERIGHQSRADDLEEENEALDMHNRFLQIEVERANNIVELLLSDDHFTTLKKDGLFREYRTV